jgi:hypothetical protein
MYLTGRWGAKQAAAPSACWTLHVLSALACTDFGVAGPKGCRVVPAEQFAEVSAVLAVVGSAELLGTSHDVLGRVMVTYSQSLQGHRWLPHQAGS